MFELPKRYEIENALVMHASDFVYLPAFSIYSDISYKPFIERIEKCHVYIIGLVPSVKLVKATQIDRVLYCHIKYGADEYKIPFELPLGTNLASENGPYYLTNEVSERFFPSEQEMFKRFAELISGLVFDVQYIGQAYGKNGSRNALQRLKKHETLQKISITGIPTGFELYLLLLNVKQASQVVTLFNPFANETNQSEERMDAGIEKLHNTSEQERITLFEAALIRHFEPKFNTEFKASFPSTNMKVLADCYDKDFSAIVAEIYFDEIPVKLKSGKQEASSVVTAIHHLNTAEDRKIFFI